MPNAVAGMAKNHVEDGIQRALAQHLRLRAKRGVVWWHTPNGGKRNVREAGRFKAMGVRPGVSDIVAVHDGKIFALELKAPGGRPTETQLAFLADIRDAGGFTACTEGIDRAVAVLESWGLLRGAA